MSNQVERLEQMKRGLKAQKPTDKITVELTAAELAVLIDTIEFTRDSFDDESIAAVATRRELGGVLSKLSEAQGAALLKAGRLPISQLDVTGIGIGKGRRGGGR